MRQVGTGVLVGLGCGLALALVARAAPGAPSPPPRAPLNEVLVVSLAGKGVELRPALARVRALQPGLRACVEPMAPTRGTLQVVLTVRKRVIAEVQVTGALAATHGECVRKVFAGLALEAAASQAELTALVLVRPVPAPAADEAALPEIEPREELVIRDDLTCEGVRRFVCPPNKDCAPPPRRKVRCAATAGVPARLPLGDRRLVLRISGGKTGQTGEALILAEGGGQCVLVVMTNQGAEELTGGTESREDVDLPCARARAVHALAQRLGLGNLRKPKATSNVHGVTYRWELWRPGKGGVPVVREGGWTGDSPRAWQVFDQVARALGALAREYATLQPARMQP